MTEPKQTDWEAELKKALNDRRTGLRDSSDTNKNRYNILAIFEEAISLARKEEREKVIMEAQFEFAGLGKMTDAKIVDRLDSLKKLL